MSKQKIPVSGGFFSNTNLINVKVSTIIEVFDFFRDLLFEGKEDRIIYSSNNYAFRERVASNKLNAGNDNLLVQNLNLPFMNFYMTGLTANTSRRWKSHSLETFGQIDWNIRKKIRMIPVKLQFEGMVYTNKETDKHHIDSELAWYDAQEGIIEPKLEIDDQEFKNIGVVYFNVGYHSQFNEADWLTRNKIRTTQINFEVDTFLIKTETKGFCIPKHILVNFAASQKLDLENVEYTDLIEGVINHIDEVVEL